MRPTALALAACIALAACGSSAQRSPPPRATAAPSSCSAAAQRAMAAVVGAQAVSATAYSPPDGSQGCRLGAAGASHTDVSVDVHVDTLPQPFARLDREAVETTQTALWSHSRTTPSPINGLGEAAYWLPRDSRLIATDGARLISVAVAWPGVRRARRLGLATAMARTYLSGAR